MNDLVIDPRKEARKILNRFRITEPSIDVKSIAEKLGAQVVFQDAPGDLSGMVYVGANGTVIGVNKQNHEPRQRFTIAHEIGHMVMHMHILEGNVHIDKGFGVQLNRDKRSALGDDLLEIQANRFAAELLMPTEMIKREIKNTYIDFEGDDESIKELAEKYNVSQQAMSIKLFELIKNEEK